MVGEACRHAGVTAQPGRSKPEVGVGRLRVAIFSERNRDGAGAGWEETGWAARSGSGRDAYRYRAKMESRSCPQPPVTPGLGAASAVVATATVTRKYYFTREICYVMSTRETGAFNRPVSKVLIKERADGVRYGSERG